MKILFTLNSSNYGGMEKTVLDLVKGLPGVLKFVVCPEGDYSNEFKEFAKFYKYRTIKKFDWEYIKFLRKIIHENQIDIVHANEPKIVFNTLIACVFTKVKLKVTHTHTPISLWQTSPFSRFVNIVLNTFAINLLSDYEIALTESIKDQKIKEGILPHKIKIIPNSIDSVFLNDVDSYSKTTSDLKFINSIYSKNKYSFLFLSRLTKEKNQILLIESFYEFNKKYPDSELILAGKGADYDTLKKKVRDLNLINSVRLVTQVSERDKLNLYLNCDCFVFPSLAEGFGITLLEAMYTCYPVLSSNLKVLKEVTKNKLVYFKSNTKKSLLSKMVEVYTTKKDMKILQENQKFIKETYSIENYINNYLEIYKL